MEGPYGGEKQGPYGGEGPCRELLSSADETAAPSGGYCAPGSPDLLKDAFWVVLGLHYCMGFSPFAEKRPALVWRAGFSLWWLLLWRMGSGACGLQ